MELTAKLIQLLPLQTGTGKNGEWKKQEFIVETEGQYPKKICVSMWGDKIDNNVLREGHDITISFDIESREYNSRWYTDVKAWKVQLAGGDSNEGVQSSPPDSYTVNDPEASDPGVEDDLPF